MTPTQDRRDPVATGLRECWGSSHLYGPFEDAYSCVDLDDAELASG